MAGAAQEEKTMKNLIQICTEDCGMCPFGFSEPCEFIAMPFEIFDPNPRIGCGTHQRV